MTLRHGLLTLSETTAVQVVIDDTDEVRIDTSVSVQNIDTEANVYLGDSTVTTEDYGYILLPGQSFVLAEVGRYPGLFAVTDAGGSQIAVLRISL